MICLWIWIIIYNYTQGGILLLMYLWKYSTFFRFKNFFLRLWDEYYNLYNVWLHFITYEIYDAWFRRFNDAHEF